MSHGTGSRTCLLLAISLCCGLAHATPPRQLALAWQDHILRIAVARQQMTAEQADSQLRAFGQGIANEPEADRMNDLRRGLDEAFEGWLGAIEQQAATTRTWPAGRSAADWRLLVEVNVAQLREAMFEALVADQDPLPVLQKTAQVAGWTRGEQLSDQPLVGHAERIAALLAGKPLPKAVAAPKEKPLVPAQRQRLHFDQLSAGPLPSDAFAGTGVRIVQHQGVPGIYKSDAAMVLPAGRSQVLLVAGDRTTSLTFLFDPPVRRFSLTRIGTAGGSSVPTWRLQAINSNGAVVGSAGEEFSMPATPKQHSIDGAGIVRVVLSTDNRYGEGTLATWNSLPVAEFDFER